MGLTRSGWFDDETFYIGMSGEKPSVSAMKACAEWLALCVSRLGWRKEQLGDLEKLWWEHHDQLGRLKSLER